MEKEFVEKCWSNCERQNDPFEDLLNLRKYSYNLYKENCLALLQKELEQIGIIDNMIKCKKAINIIDSYKQSSKSRSGKNLELFICKILEQYNIKFHYQKFKDIKGDFIFEKNNKYIILSIKTSLKERWKEFLDDIQDDSIVYILTLEEISDCIINKLHSKDIKIINYDIKFKDFLYYLKNIEMNKYNFIDLFCGAGGMSTGFEQQGFNPLIGIDNNIKCIQTYSANREHVKTINENIKLIPACMIQEKIENQNVNLIIGGPPCTSVSLAGKRDPNDIRNTLFMDFIRIINYFKPQIVVMENVVGLLTAKDKNNNLILDNIINEYKNIGYNVNYKKLNAYDFGVPQKRKRIIFVCIRNDINKEYKFPDSVENKNNVDSVLESKVEQKYYFTEKMIEGFKKRKENNKLNGKGFGYQILKLDQPSYTISARYYKDGSEAIVDENGKWRKLTEKEVAKIQTFPDNYIFKGSSSDIYTQIGNAVPCLLANKIAESIKLFLRDVNIEYKVETKKDSISYTLSYEDILSYNKPELINLCKQNNIKGYSKFKKCELIEYIKEKLNL